MIITIYLRSISNKLFEILIDQNASINDLKIKLSNQVKITKEHLLILFHNQLCAEDDATLIEYDIFDKDILTFEVKKISDPIKTFGDNLIKFSYTHRNIIKKL